MLKRAILIVTTITLVASVSGANQMAYAATNPQSVGQALEIAPPIVNLTVSPGQTTSVRIYIRDVSTTNLIVTGQANDFVAAGEDGTPKLLLNDNGSDPYSMKNWITDLPSLTLIPREIKAMTITLKVPQNATPGGHYGVVRFTATPPDLKDTGVSLSASLGALLLVTVTGTISENLSVQEFSVNQNEQTGSFFESAPLNFLERFKNSGNIHEQPTGQVVVTDMLGHKFAVLTVNQSSSNVLPNSIRKYEEKLDETVIGDKKMFGRYTAELKVTYGESKKTLTSTVSFWVIPYKLILFTLLGLVLAFFGMRTLIRSYNRRIVAKAQRTRRR